MTYLGKCFGVNCYRPRAFSYIILNNIYSNIQKCLRFFSPSITVSLLFFLDMDCACTFCTLILKDYHVQKQTFTPQAVLMQLLEGTKMCISGTLSAPSPIHVWSDAGGGQDANKQQFIVNAGDRCQL